MKSIGLIILVSFSYAAQINIYIFPDTIYVGSLVKIKIVVTYMKDEEIPIFKDYNKTNINYSTIDKVLTNNSAEYTFQFWDDGSITLPPFNIDIVESNQNVTQIQTKEITLNILTNIIAIVIVSLAGSYLVPAFLI